MTDEWADESEPIEDPFSPAGERERSGLNGGKPLHGHIDPDDARPDRGSKLLAEARQFLELLLGGLPGIVDLRLIPPDGGLVSRFGYSAIDPAMFTIGGAARQMVGIYVGCSTRLTAESGEKSNLAFARMFWVDRDIKDQADREAFKLALETFPLSPSMVVNSGGGIHLYWILREPVDLSVKENITRFEHTLKGLADFLGGDMAATDASRVMRVPGTQNWPNSLKRAKGRVASPCRIVHVEPEHTFALDDFADFELRGAARAAGGSERHGYEQRAPGGELSASVAKLVHSIRQIGRLYRRDETCLDAKLDSSPSGIDYSLALELALRNILGAEIEDALRLSRAQHGVPDGHKARDYYSRTVEKALGCAAKMRGEPRAGGSAENHEQNRGSDSEGAPETEIPPRRMRWRTMDEIKEEKTEWLSYPRIPRGKVVTLDGFEGCGKTFFAGRCCSDLSRGRPLFGAPHTEYTDPQVSIYMTAEDGLGDTIKPRLAAMDADMTKIVVLDGPIWKGEEDPFSLFDFDLIEQVIVETGAVLFVLDPVFAYLEDKDPAKTKDVRPILKKLTGLAERTSCTFLLIRHLKKGAEERANHRSGGCVDWAAVARSMLLLVEDPEDREKRVIAHSKSNLAPKGPTLRFEILGMDVQWRGESSLDADDVLRPRGSQDDEDGAQSAKAEAAEFLRVELADGPMPQKKLEEAAKDAHISWSTIKRAQRDLKIKPRPQTGEDGKKFWLWALPTAKRSWEARDDN